jgi:hypothetical protein
MMTARSFAVSVGILSSILAFTTVSAEDRPPMVNKGDGAGWRALTEADFEKVNCDPETFTWKDGQCDCTGMPIGMLKTKFKLTNFEMVAEWRHLTSGGNSGIFLWAPDEALKDLPRNTLARGGIEVQVLDHGYAEQFEKKNGKKSDWFTTHGDVFPVGTSKMKPFPPSAPNGQRSFPKKNLSKGVNEWNHYYIKAVDGVVRLSVNGEEVSGGENCEPRTGFLCLESEGAPIQFRNLRLHELP